MMCPRCQQLPSYPPAVPCRCPCHDDSVLSDGRRHWNGAHPLGLVLQQITRKFLTDTNAHTV
eukprot:scaffold1268_cov133-Skeletonema_marinoi.AAC.15